MKAKIISFFGVMCVLTACVFDEPIQLKTENVLKVDTLVVDTSKLLSKCPESYFGEDIISGVYDFKSICVIERPIANRALSYDSAIKIGCPINSTMPTKKDLAIIADLIVKGEANPDFISTIKAYPLPSIDTLKGEVYALFSGELMPINKSGKYPYRCILRAME